VVIFYTAVPGTRSAEALQLLRVIGTQELADVMSTSVEGALGW
jgi:hypothetical protein